MATLAAVQRGVGGGAKGQGRQRPPRRMVYTASTSTCRHTLTLDSHPSPLLHPPPPACPLLWEYGHTHLTLSCRVLHHFPG